MGKLYVCTDATLECSFGDKTGKFSATSDQVKIQGNKMGTVADNIPKTNIPTFGKCSSLSNPTVAAATAANNGKLKPMPCVPVIPAPWSNAKTKVTVAGNAALLESSKLSCAYAGIITVSDPGQALVTD